ncbi:hypothetical protein BUALT_Bualt03G0092900 [Buddleja alternifolia]|uniref:DUF4283 domain-containing protein n=1 Tax=Buddleja alternifolia TaxID=168488 RepID=A0AAV6Y0G4_9LAMI|nr:hypothetical protein BUALT_Bualt03G0092900 [Buddleja alternifolia]
MDPQPTVAQGVASATEKSTASKSYVESLKGNSFPQDLADKSAKKALVHGVDSKIIGTSSLHNGRKTIFLSKEEDEFMAAPFQYSLVGKFSHGYPSMTRLRSKFAALGLTKGFKIGVLDHKHVWIRLFYPNDYARVWMKQTWYFDGFPMRVLKWTSEFDPNEESPVMPIWIKVFGLRPHWFHRQFLYHVASLIGKPLKLDEATTQIDNPVVARMCVEINVLERLQSDIPIQIGGKTKFFKVQYEGIPEYCKICRHRGHSVAACYLNKENQDQEVISKNLTEKNDGADLRAMLDRKKGKLPMSDTDEGTNMQLQDVILKDPVTRTVVTQNITKLVTTNQGEPSSIPELVKEGFKNMEIQAYHSPMRMSNPVEGVLKATNQENLINVDEVEEEDLEKNGLKAALNIALGPESMVPNIDGGKQYSDTENDLEDSGDEGLIWMRNNENSYKSLKWLTRKGDHEYMNGLKLTLYTSLFLVQQERNKSSHNDEDSRHLITIDSIRHSVEETKHLVGDDPEALVEAIQVGWTRPKLDWFKLNVDASVQKDHMHQHALATIGGLVRDMHGGWHGGFAGLSVLAFEVHVNLTSSKIWRTTRVLQNLL